MIRTYSSGLLNSNLNCKKESVLQKYGGKAFEREGTVSHSELGNHVEPSDHRKRSRTDRLEGDCVGL